MYHVIGQCPVCKDELIVSKLSCPHCGVTLEGHFALGPWYKLDAEQLHFLELFLQNQGKITWVAAELGLSYPTARNRFQDILATLGLQSQQHAPEDNRQQRQAILDDLAAGKLSPENAADLLQQLAESDA